MGLNSIAQSPSWKNHSTETAPLNVKKRHPPKLNKQHVTLLVLLGLSAAFDTVHHGILLEVLNKLRLKGKVFVCGYRFVVVSLRVLE